MTYWEALLLGVLQGLTEFLPVSSSGHLVLAQELMGVARPGAALEIAVHLGTLVAVLWHYRRDVSAIARDVLVNGPLARLGWTVVVGTLPAVLVGLFLKDRVEAALDSPRIAAACLVATGVLLLLTRFARRREGEPGFGHALIVGVAQAVAILPGVSRSGSTIGTALFLGDEPVRAARFSFLLSIPAILGATVLTVKDGGFAASGELPQLVVAAVAAFVSGLLALVLLLRVLAAGRLSMFGPYCIAAGVLAWWLVS